MSRVNMMLFGILILLAIGVVHAQHRARHLFVDLQKEKDVAEQLTGEWNQLQTEQGTLASSHRVEEGAVRVLQMQVPEAARIHLLVTAKPAEGGSR